MAEKDDREKVIDVALDLCIMQGYEATTIDQIAAADGVTSHAVGRYFATKDAIILSIADDIVRNGNCRVVRNVHQGTLAQPPSRRHRQIRVTGAREPQPTRPSLGVPVKKAGE